MVAAGAPIIPKNSVLARAIWNQSRVVLGARTRTSLASLLARRFLSSAKSFGKLGTGTSLGGQIGRAVPYVGWGLLAGSFYIGIAPYEKAVIQRQYGGDAFKYYQEVLRVGP